MARSHAERSVVSVGKLEGSKLVSLDMQSAIHLKGSKIAESIFSMIFVLFLFSLLLYLTAGQRLSSRPHNDLGQCQANPLETCQSHSVSPFTMI